jgi:hypothetical protein
MLLLARILLDYDVKMPEGQTRRYANLAMANYCVADMKEELLFRRRLRG